MPGSDKAAFQIPRTSNRTALFFRNLPSEPARCDIKIVE